MSVKGTLESIKSSTHAERRGS